MVKQANFAPPDASVHVSQQDPAHALMQAELPVDPMSGSSCLAYILRHSRHPNHTGKLLLT